MKFFFDRCLPVRLAKMLDAYDTENQVVHQDEDGRFTNMDEDIKIIATLADENPPPVLITADVNMYTRRPDERLALRNSNLTCVFIKKGFNNLPIHDQAVKMLKLWPQIVEQTSRCKEPTAFEISPSATKLQRYRLTRDL
jgi:predicted nuclease of predicted toxin-antitoxin system